MGCVEIEDQVDWKNQMTWRDIFLQSNLKY